MKNIGILVGNDFGDNIYEWLSMEGFQTSRITHNALSPHTTNTDVFICAEDDLEPFTSDEFANLITTKPCIILGEDKSRASKWLQKYSFLKIPFNFEELLGLF